MFNTQIPSNTKTQVQVDWLDVKMLDNSMKAPASGYRCDDSSSYDDCMYGAVTKVSHT